MSNFALATLGDVAEFVRGVTYKPAEVSNANDPMAIACMRTKNIQEDLEDDDLVFIPRAPIKSEKILRLGDILVSSANSWNLLGKSSWVPDLPYPATFGGFTSVLRVTSARVLSRYLYLWFSTERIQRLVRSFGQQTTNISNLNQSRCLRLEIPVPPLEEQRRIAAILDKADALRRKRKRVLDHFDQLRRSVFMEMFSDITNGNADTTLEQFSDIQVGFAFKSSEYTEHSDGVKLCRGANVLPNFIDWSDLARWPKERAAEFSEYNLSVGDIVIAMDRPWISSGFKVARIAHEDLPALLVQRVARLRPKNEVYGEFLFGLVRSSFFSSHFKPTETTVPHISPIEVRAFSMPQFAPNVLQEFAKFSIHTREAESAASSAMLNCEELFSSLQYSAFSGQL